MDRPWHRTIRRPLRHVLDRYYEVSGRSFESSSPLQIARHQLLHVIKLLKKLIAHEKHASTKNADVVKYEVAPDLVIYAEELMQKFEIDVWPTLSEKDDAASLSVYLGAFTSANSMEDVVLQTATAAAALADICDQDDHNQVSVYSVEHDVVRPFVVAAATIVRAHRVDIDMVYSNRLREMVEKYESWSEE